MKPNSLFWSQPARLHMSMPMKTTSPAEQHILPYTQRQLFQRALNNLPRIVKPAREVPLWLMVRELFDCGEDVAHRICWSLGFDPDGVCGRSTTKPSLPWEDLDDGK